MADASERFSTEAIRPQLAQVFEGLDLGRREPLAEDGEIGFLRSAEDVSSAYSSYTEAPSGLYWSLCPPHQLTAAYPDARAVVLDLQQLEPALLDCDADAGGASV